MAWHKTAVTPLLSIRYTFWYMRARIRLRIYIVFLRGSVYVLHIFRKLPHGML